MKKALGTHVVVIPITEKVEVAGGLELTESMKKDIRYKKGEVVAVGEAGEEKLKKGDIVLYNGATGFSAMIGSDMYTIIQYRDIAGVI